MFFFNKFFEINLEISAELSSIFKINIKYSSFYVISLAVSRLKNNLLTMISSSFNFRFEPLINTIFSNF